VAARYVIVSNGPDHARAGRAREPNKDAASNALKALRLNPQLKKDFNDTVPKTR